MKSTTEVGNPEGQPSPKKIRTKSSKKTHNDANKQSSDKVKSFRDGVKDFYQAKAWPPLRLSGPTLGKFNSAKESFFYQTTIEQELFESQ